MKHRILFLTFLLHFSPTLFCSFKRGQIPLSIDVQPEGEEVVGSFIKDKDKANQRNASRGYVLLMNQLLVLKMEKNLDLGIFKKICCDVEDYKNQYFHILAGNQLLHDGEHDPYINPFNSELLSKLENIANDHGFPLGLVPFKVVLSDSD